MSEGLCQSPGCGEPAGEFAYGPRVNGVLYCAKHAIIALQEEVAQGARTGKPLVQGTPEERRQGRPDTSGWLNQFARLCCETMELPANHIVKADIEARAEIIYAEHPIYRFSISRHPVGRVMIQEWEVNIEELVATLLSEKCVKTDFPVEGDAFLCPECRQELDLTPGRALCHACGFRRNFEYV